MTDPETLLASTKSPQIDLDNLPEPNLIRYPGSKGIPIETIIELRKKNLSCSQIATLLKCNPSNITRRLKTIDEAIETTNHYRSNRGFLLSLEQNRIRHSITNADLKRAGLRDKVISIGVLFDKERLEEGKSTENIASIHSAIEAIQSKGTTTLNSIPNKIPVSIDDDL